MSPSLLPRCVPTRRTHGTLAVGATRVPLTVATGDQSAALFAAAEKTNLIPALAAAGMTGLAVAGLIYNSPRKRFVWAWDSFSIILVYATDFALLLAFK